MATTSDTTETDPPEILRHRHPLVRGIELLTLMIDSHQEAHGVRELAGRIGVSPSTVHRLLTDLDGLGLVTRTSTGSYRLGLEFLRLAWTTTSRFPVHEVATHTLTQLAEQSGESSFFGLYSEQRHEMMFALTVESPHPLRYTLPERQWLPLHAGASGLAILAFLPEEVRDEIAFADLTTSTARTVIDPQILLNRLATIRDEGYAITHGERIQGAVAIAAPVFGPSTEILGSTGITIPEARFDGASSRSLASMVRQAATRLTGYMSGTRDMRTGLVRRS